MTFTPGPWGVSNSGGRVITADMRHPRTIAILEDVPLSISPEVEANAHLIAASPDLLEACKWAARSCHHPACEYAKGKSYNCNCHVGAAKAAIDKALSQ